MENELITRRKLIKALSWFRNRKFCVEIIDTEDSSWLGCRVRKYEGVIDHYEIMVDEMDATLVVRIWFVDGKAMESQWIHIGGNFRRSKPTKVSTWWSNGDGTESSFEIRVVS